MDRGNLDIERNIHKLNDNCNKSKTNTSKMNAPLGNSVMSECNRFSACSFNLETWNLENEIQ